MKKNLVIRMEKNWYYIYKKNKLTYRALQTLKIPPPYIPPLFRELSYSHSQRELPVLWSPLLLSHSR